MMCAKRLDMSPPVTVGVDRNDPDGVRSHLYVPDPEVGGLVPMCGYGWNRSDGSAFSIFRGWASRRGICKLCERNLAAGRPPVTEGWPHPTRWI